LPVEICFRPLLDSAGDLAHSLIARGGVEDAADEPACEEEAGEGAKKRERNTVGEEHLGCDYHKTL